MSTRPNFLFILADDLGWRDLSIEGSTFYESPNIDRIAREGMRFTQGYATCQVCSPSRASIMTGKYTPRHGVTDWIGAPSGTDWREAGRHSKLLPPVYEHGLRSDEVTIAEALRRSGYTTFFAGKWHLGGPGSYPEDHGFDINIGGWEVGGPSGGYFSPYANPKLTDGPAGESLPIRLARETASFIEGHQDEPFFAYLSFYSVHGPIQTSKDRWAKYQTKPGETVAAPPPADSTNKAAGAVASGTNGDNRSRFIFDRYLPTRVVQDNPVYAGMIEAMDDAVGVVLEALDKTGLAENTVVVFTSDNGGVSSGDAFATSNLPLRGGKGRQWEGGIREPLYLRAPKMVAKQTTCDVPVSFIDFYPTFLELADADRPTEQHFDGLSLVPLLQSPGARPAASEQTAATLGEFDRDLFWHYPHYGNQGGEPSSIIRRGPWKLIHYYEDGRDELYNLETDPGETTDVLGNAPERRGVTGAAIGASTAAAGEDAQRETTGEHRTIATELRTRLDAWLDETGARLPTADPEYNAAAEAARLEQLESETMASLEDQAAAYRDPTWQPNDDWWGSMVTVD